MDYLQQQAADARAAMSATVRDLGRVVTGTVDVAEWTRQYPFIATGSALAAGFLAAIVVVPDKSGDATVKAGRSAWGKIKSIWSAKMHSKNGKESSADPAAASASAATPPAAPASEWAWLGTLLHEIYTVLRPVLVGLITAAMARPKPQSDGQDAG